MSAHSAKMQAQMGEFVLNTTKGYVVYCAAQLDLVEHLSRKPMNANELAALTKTHTASLYRLLRGLAAIDFLKEEKDGRFTVTESGEFLKGDVKGSIKYPILYHFGSHCVALPKLSHTVKTGETAFDHIFGTHYYDYLKHHPEDAEYCMKSLTQYASDVAPTLIAAYDFKPFKHIVDIGGGNGAFLTAILQNAINSTGTVFDEQYVIEENGKILGQTQVDGRLKAVKGSFFDSIPTGGDCYVLKYILHNWDDESCEKILRNIRAVMKPDTKLVVFDDMLDGTPNTEYLKMLDCLFMACFSGKVRTEHEYKVLIEKCGFKVQRVIKTDGCFTAITEAIAH